MADLTRIEDYFVGRFSAMANPCEVLVDTDQSAHARAALAIAEREALRIERKFSRYRTDSVVHEIHRARGRPVAVDAETAQLIDYAATCWELSDGMFDITSGVLRKVWTFDGGSAVPSEDAVREVLAQVGWSRVTWDGRSLTLPEGMEIDLGGIGKEYAVDKAAGLVAAEIGDAFVVNFGGDLYASGARRGDRPWRVGVDDPDQPGRAVLHQIELRRGGLATSGAARRFVMHQGRRLGHILNPKTGWPIEGAPRAVTVLAATCVEAGTLSTLAYLRGPDASDFLRDQGATFQLV